MVVAPMVVVVARMVVVVFLILVVGACAAGVSCSGAPGVLVGGSNGEKTKAQPKSLQAPNGEDGVSVPR